MLGAEDLKGWEMLGLLHGYCGRTQCRGGSMRKEKGEGLRPESLSVRKRHCRRHHTDGPVQWRRKHGQHRRAELLEWRAGKGPSPGVERLSSFFVTGGKAYMWAKMF